MTEEGLTEGLFKPCYSKDDFIAHARLMKGHYEKAGRKAEPIGSDGLEIIRNKAASMAKAQTWALVALWLEDLPNFKQGEEKEI